ncbi:MAG: hypothetical protein ACYTGZ_14320 [Planctomycetota bacterium]|jgi:hypothetical protein
MTRTLLPLVLCTSILASGCASWNVNAFGVAVHRPGQEARASAPARPPLSSAPLAYYAASDDDYGKLSKEEKWGVILILGVAVAAAIIFAANA